MIKISWQERKQQQRKKEKRAERQYQTDNRINRTLFEASFTKRPEESQQEFRARIDAALELANRALGVWPIEGKPSS